MTEDRRYNLEDRVASFAARVIAVCEALPARIGSAHLKDQLFRSATSVAANYAEASVPESRKDFAHKMNVALKELVESRMWLKIISLKSYVKPEQLVELISETNELVRIFSTSVSTARKKLSEQECRK